MSSGYPYAPGYRTGDPVTSVEAAEAIESSAASQRVLLEEAYRKAGPEGLSNYEAGIAAGLGEFGYWRRCSELFQQGAVAPVLDDEGEPVRRVNPVTNMSQIVHRYVPPGERSAPSRRLPSSPERNILVDLIAKLRAVHRPAADLDGELRLCAEGCGTNPCLTHRYADEAEARLREVSPEFPEGATVADVSMSLTKGHDDE